MDFSIFIIVLFGLLILSLIAGSRFAGQLKDKDDYFLAGRNVKFFPLMMTFVATQVGGGLVLGAAEEAYSYGWAVLLLPLGSSLGFVLLGLGIGRKMAQFKVSTVAQIFEVVYKSSMLKRIASVLSIVSLFMILAAQVMASKKFMVSIGFDSNIVFLIFWGVIIIYTVLGGLRGVVATDVIQAAFFIVVFALCFIYLETQSSISLGTLMSQDVQRDSFQFSAAKLCGWLLMPLLFMVIEQDMGQRCFAAKTPPVVSKAAMGAALCTFAVCIIPVYIGVLGKSAGVDVAKGSSVLMTIIDALASPAVAALTSCAVLAAVLSTAVSLINAISSNLSQDFELVFLTKTKEVRMAQCITAVIAVLGIVCSFYFDNIVDLLIQSYELSVSCLFVPVFAALFKKQGCKRSALLAMVCGGVGFILFRLVSIPVPKEIASVILSAIGFGLGELLAERRVEGEPEVALYKGIS